MRRNGILSRPSRSRRLFEEGEPGVRRRIAALVPAVLQAPFGLEASAEWEATGNRSTWAGAPDFLGSGIHPARRSNPRVTGDG